MIRDGFINIYGKLVANYAEGDPLPCPQCGNKELEIEREYQYDPPGARVRCPKCKYAVREGTDGLAFSYISDEAIEKAIAAWNLECLVQQAQKAPAKAKPEKTPEELKTIKEERKKIEKEYREEYERKYCVSPVIHKQPESNNPLRKWPKLKNRLRTREGLEMSYKNCYITNSSHFYRLIKLVPEDYTGNAIEYVLANIPDSYWNDEKHILHVPTGWIKDFEFWPDPDFYPND